MIHRLTGPLIRWLQDKRLIFQKLQVKPGTVSYTHLLCAVGGTINEDDHMFGLSAAKKYGGIYVPPPVSYTHLDVYKRQEWCKTHAIGTGPFIMDEFVTDNKVTYHKNPDYRITRCV